jgi:hypothetical protein
LRYPLSSSGYRKRGARSECHEFNQLRHTPTVNGLSLPVRSPVTDG